MNGDSPWSSQGTPRADVAEFQGIYGAFEFPERLLQKIWHLGFFLPIGLKTEDGRVVEVVESGDWNRIGGGPDFKNAVLKFDGVEVRGDVELHFHPRDWQSHRHSENPAFDRVVLHVSLFKPDDDSATARTSKGESIPLLVLLPHLTCSIEEFALDDALEQVTGASARAGLLDFLRGRPAEDVLAELTRLASIRWKNKITFARIRIERLGWEGACHHTALEILGYGHNRAPMLSVAEAFPLRSWTEGTPAIDQLMNVGGTRWRVLGARPANHPRVRLGQYAEWIRNAPDWTSRLALLPGWLPSVDGDNPIASVDKVRRGGLTKIRERVAQTLVGGAVGGSRLDTIVTNGFLPLLAANGAAELFPAWCCWFAGDAPDWLKATLREVPAVAGKRLPLCEGLVQAALQLSIEQPASESRLGTARRDS